MNIYNSSSQRMWIFTGVEGQHSCRCI